MAALLLRRGAGAAARAAGGAQAGVAIAAAAAQRRAFAVPAVQIYQYEICPFCCKLKAFLDWQGVPYKTTEVNPVSKAEIKFSEKYRKVPIAIIDGQQVNDSSEIMSALATKLDKAQVREALSDPETAKWLQWCDKELAVLLFPNITRSLSESWTAFKYISEVPTFGAGTKAVNQLAGSIAMWLANGKLKKKYNITDERKQLLDTVQAWLDAVGEGPFLKGAQSPGLPDVAVYGVLSSIRGQPAYADLLAAKPALERWVARMREAIGKSQRIEDPPVRRQFGLTAP